MSLSDDGQGTGSRRLDLFHGLFDVRPLSVNERAVNHLGVDLLRPGSFGQQVHMAELAGGGERVVLEGVLKVQNALDVAGQNVRLGNVPERAG